MNVVLHMSAIFVHSTTSKWMQPSDLHGSAYGQHDKVLSWPSRASWASFCTDPVTFVVVLYLL